MKNSFLVAFLLSLSITVRGFTFITDTSSNKTVSQKIFTKDDISNIADKYVHNNLNISNSIFIDFSRDGIFDMIAFEDGSVKFYKNVGTLEEPYFRLEDSKLDKHEMPSLLKPAIPYPIFLADSKGEGNMDIFAVKQLDYNTKTKKYDYRILQFENVFSLDDDTLVTLILASAMIIFFVTYIIFIAAH